ncbi:hypothetical protein CYMTET_35719 [Cymbomonas tetramitiformis]|uniref:PD-(D/E)XK endonuclease-like domain-containing protein n=1 Tax=Cymbomonas tetramitiformis TaxID=36881 RepID=A0AAE0KNK3_9CHLO|nr:hypothetical protein CYMTET_35719 [Cymbomonas tetramitiformis]
MKTGPSSPLCLAELNAHERDARISFDQQRHKYFIDDDGRNLVSVTTYLKRFFEEFDGNRIIRIHGSRWRATPGHKYEKKTDEAILQEWEENRVAQSGLGTCMHERIEAFYNRPDIGDRQLGMGDLREPDSPPLAPEDEQFDRFHQAHKPVPYRTEMRVFDTTLRLAGSVDMLAYETCRSGSDSTRYVMYDWKRSSKELSPDAPHYGRMCRGVLAHLPDTAYTHYVMQQNMYAHLLKECYDTPIDRMYLVRFHPSIDDYQLVRVPRWKDEVEAVLRHRRKHLRLTRLWRGLAVALRSFIFLSNETRATKRVKRSYASVSVVTKYAERRLEVFARD